MNKPWGSETVCYQGEYVVKRLEVDAGQRLSLQYHPQKTETLVVFEGEPVVQVGEAYVYCHPGSVVHIPQGQQHRISAPLGRAVLIECATPHDDTVRVEDDYGRAS